MKSVWVLLVAGVLGAGGYAVVRWQPAALPAAGGAAEARPLFVDERRLANLDPRRGPSRTVEELVARPAPATAVGANRANETVVPQQPPDTAARKRADDERIAREAEAKRAAEAVEAARLAEQKRLADEAAARKRADDERIAREAEAKRAAEAAEAARLAEQKRLADEAAARKRADDERIAREAEAKRAADQAVWIAEQQRRAEEQAARQAQERATEPTGIGPVPASVLETARRRAAGTPPPAAAVPADPVEAARATARTRAEAERSIRCMAAANPNKDGC